MKFSTTPVRFGSVGDVALELRKALTAIAAGWNVEHNPDGTHGAITADTITADTITADTVTGGTITAEPGGNVALTDANNTFTRQQFIQNVNPFLGLSESDQPVGFANWVLIVDGQRFSVDAADTNYTTLTTLFQVNRTGGLYERGRTTPMGEWTDVPFSAANFTATGGTWTVTAATYAYILLGKTVFFSLQIPGASTITGAPTALNVAYPAGLGSPVRSVGTSFHYVMAGSTTGTGLCQMHTSIPATLLLTRDATSTAFTAGTCFIYLQGHYSIS